MRLSQYLYIWIVLCIYTNTMGGGLSLNTAKASIGDADNNNHNHVVPALTSRSYMQRQVLSKQLDNKYQPPTLNKLLGNDNDDINTHKHTSSRGTAHHARIVDIPHSKHFAQELQGLSRIDHSDKLGNRKLLYAGNGDSNVGPFDNNGDGDGNVDRLSDNGDDSNDNNGNRNGHGRGGTGLHRNSNHRFHWDEVDHITHDGGTRNRKSVTTPPINLQY